MEQNKNLRKFSGMSAFRGRVRLWRTCPPLEDVYAYEGLTDTSDNDKVTTLKY
jgi:hypothetical protein